MVSRNDFLAHLRGLSDEQLFEVLRLVDAEAERRRYGAADRIIDVHTAARIAGCSTRTVYRWAHDYGLGFQYPTGGWRIKQGQLEAFLRWFGELGTDDPLPKRANDAP